MDLAECTLTSCRRKEDWAVEHQKRVLGSVLAERSNGIEVAWIGAVVDDAIFCVFKVRFSFSLGMVRNVKSKETWKIMKKVLDRFLGL